MVADGCFDRVQVSHAVNLCDRHAKYADVIASEEAHAFVAKLPRGLFDLPKGAA